MASYQLGLYEKAMPSDLTWKERMEAARDADFDYIELSIDESDERLARLDWSKDTRKELLNLVLDTGVPFGSICLSGHRKYPLGSNDPSICAQSLDIMRKSLELAADLGIRYIQLAGYDVYYEESSADTVRRFKDNLTKCADMAARYGVLLGFETMETPFMDTVQKAMFYVDAISSPYLGVYPDLGNLNNASLIYGVPVSDDLKTGAGYIIAAHIKETKPGKYRDVPFKTGCVDFGTLIKTCWQLGVRRYVTELWYHSGDAWRDHIREAALLAREILRTLDKEI
ncbi:MAG: L-ribulose-5-phosphate 3-epimerase [Bacillota bacterium]